MKKMKIEKQLIFADHVNKVLALQVHEGLTYKHEDGGIRALGPLFIKGQYEGDEGVENFQETLEMDVFAPNHKLGDDEFRLEVADYQGKIADDGITIFVTMNIHGLKTDDNSNPNPQPIIAQEIPSPIVEKMAQPQMTSVSKEETVITKPMEHDDVSDTVTQEDESGRSVVDDFNDLFADAESTYTSYRIVVAKPDDSYGSIAKRYEVDENDLRGSNKNKDIMAKSLVILPFAQK